MRWKRNEVKRGPSRCCLDCSHEACLKVLSIEIAAICFIIHINRHIQARLPPLYKCLDAFLLSGPSDPQLRIEAGRRKYSIMPVQAHPHQHSPIPPFIASELRYEQKIFREYFHWKGVYPFVVLGKEVPFVKGKRTAGQVVEDAMHMGRVRDRSSSRAPGHGEMARDRESSAVTGTTLVDPVHMCGVHTECAWPFKQAPMSRRFNSIGLLRDIHNPCARLACARMGSLTLSRSLLRSAGSHPRLPHNCVTCPAGFQQGTQTPLPLDLIPYPKRN